MAQRKRRNDKNQIVYMMTNTITKERYIGITYMRGQAKLKSLKIRWEGHLYGAFVEGRTHSFPTHLREYAPMMDKNITKWYKEKAKYVRKLNGLFDKQILEIVRGRDNAHKREVELINELQPELNDKRQRV